MEDLANRTACRGLNSAMFATVCGTTKGRALIQGTYLRQFVIREVSRCFVCHRSSVVNISNSKSPVATAAHFICFRREQPSLRDLDLMLYDQPLSASSHQSNWQTISVNPGHRAPLEGG